jgi:hypothetical protein
VLAVGVDEVAAMPGSGFDLADAGDQELRDYSGGITTTPSRKTP